MNANLKETAVKAVLVLAGLVTVLGSTGCDETWVNGIGWVDPWYTSAYYGVPEATYYDPTNEIQSVIEYRGAAMETAANNFSDFIMQ